MQFVQFCIYFCLLWTQKRSKDSWNTQSQGVMKRKLRWWKNIRRTYAWTKTVFHVITKYWQCVCECVCVCVCASGMWAKMAHEAEKFARNSARESITMQFIKTDAARTKGHSVCVCECVSVWVYLGYPHNDNDNYILGPLSFSLCFTWAAVPIKLKYFRHKSNSKLGQAKTNELTINDCPDTWPYPLTIVLGMWYRWPSIVPNRLIVLLNGIVPFWYYNFC